MSNPAEDVLKDIIAQIKADKLRLPTLPEVALKAREAAEDPNISALTLSKVITNDAAITARDRLPGVNRQSAFTRTFERRCRL